MNKVENHEQRLAYLAISGEGNVELCCFCKLAEFVGQSSCSGEIYPECKHPLYWRIPGGEEMLEPNQDCWGFRPSVPLDIVADIIGLLLPHGRYNSASWVVRKNGIYSVHVEKDLTGEGR